MIALLLFLSVTSAVLITNINENVQNSYTFTNGDCRVQDGFVYEGGSKRPLTAIEQQQLAAYQSEFEAYQQESTKKFMTSMQENMRRNFAMQQNMMKSMFAGDFSAVPSFAPFTGMWLTDPSSMPQVPCFCSAVTCSSATLPLRSASFDSVAESSLRRKRSLIYRTSSSSASSSSSSSGGSSLVQSVSSPSGSRPLVMRTSQSWSSPPITNSFMSSSHYSSNGVPSGVAQAPLSRTSTYRDPSGVLHQNTFIQGPGITGSSRTQSYSSDGRPVNPNMMSRDFSSIDAELRAMEDGMDFLF